MSFNEVFQEGAKNFQAQDFAKASTFFQQALDLQPANTTVLVNLALSRFHSGQKIEAYDYLKKALHLDPSFLPAQQGFDYVKSQVQIREVPHRIETYEQLRDYLIKPFSVAIPLTITLALFILWGFRLIRYLSQKKRAFFAGEDPLPYGALNIFLSVLLVLSTAWVAFFKYDSLIPRGLVKLDTASLRSSPLATSPEVLQIYGGLEVQILRHQGDWLQVEYPGSIAGWIEASSILEL